MSDAKSQAGDGEADAPGHGNERGIDRRDFLRASAVLGACFADPRALRAALAQARAQGKPVLTQKTLNEFLANTNKLDAATKQKMAAEAKANLSVFLSKHFATTASQKQVLLSYTPRDYNLLRGAIDTAVEKNAAINVTISHPEPPKGTPLPRRPIPRGRSAAASIKESAGAAAWRREWLRDKLEREGRASPGDKTEVADGIAVKMTEPKATDPKLTDPSYSLKAYAHGGGKFKGNEPEYSAEVGIEATC